MKLARWILSALLAAVFLALSLADLDSVPFHPDESSWLYMSRDLPMWMSHPAALGWNPAAEPHTQPQTYRLLNAPAPYALIGLSWWLHGYSLADLNGDWNWQQAWEWNLAVGNMPAPGLLRAARLPAALLSALAVGLMFQIGCEVQGLGVGICAALLLGLNPLARFHGRHAMAEGSALFFSLLAVWGLLRFSVWLAAEKPRPLLRLGLAAVGLGALIGLAICGKQTGLALLPAAGLASVAPLWRKRQVVRLSSLWLGLGLGTALVFFALNPILWPNPWGALRAMWTERAWLVNEQSAMIRALFPDILTPDIASRLRAALLELYLRPLAAWDLPAYVTQLQPQVEAYAALPLNRFTLSLFWRMLEAGLCVAGVGFSALRLFRLRFKTSTLAEQSIWGWGSAMLALILLTTPFDWQRYFMPLVPLSCLFAGLGLWTFVKPVALLRDRLWPRPITP